MKTNTLPYAVAQMQELHLTGNVIPPNWYRTMIYRTKRGTYPHVLAINVLADICYWYRPREVRDERTGQVKRYEKRFKNHRLQRSYQQICDMFGCSEPQAREVVAFLEARSLVDKEYEHSKGGRNNWRMFLQPNVHVLKAYTFPIDVSDFDFLVKNDREFVVEAQDCELATLENTQACELATSDQDCEFASSEIANSQSPIYTETTLTENNVFILTDKEAARSRAALPSAVENPKKPKPEIHLAIDVFLEEREHWLKKRYPGQEVTEDVLAIEWTGKQVGMLKKLGTMLKAKARKAQYDYGGADGYAENVLRVFLQKYAAMNEWFCDEFLPSHIVSNFDSIYRHAKAGKQKSSGSTAADYREALERAVANL